MCCLNPTTGKVIKERNVKIYDGDFSACKQQRTEGDCRCTEFQNCELNSLFPTEQLELQVITDVIDSVQMTASGGPAQPKRQLTLDQQPERLSPLTASANQSCDDQLHPGTVFSVPHQSSASADQISDEQSVPSDQSHSSPSESNEKIVFRKPDITATLKTHNRTESTNQLDQQTIPKQIVSTENAVSEVDDEELSYRSSLNQHQPESVESAENEFVEGSANESLLSTITNNTKDTDVLSLIDLSSISEIPPQEPVISDEGQTELVNDLIGISSSIPDSVIDQEEDEEESVQEIKPFTQPISEEVSDESSITESPRRSTRSNFGKPPDRYGFSKPSDSASLVQHSTDQPDLRQVRLLTAKTVTKPTSYDEAMSQPEYSKYWKEAMADELRSFHENNVYESVKRTPGMRSISSKWVYDIKRLTGGVIDRFKARLVARGFSQREGIDYDDIFSPVVTTTAIRLLLCIAGILRYPVQQLDIKTAYLYGDIDKEIYIEPPRGCEETNHVWRLNKSLYGLKQAPKCWFIKMNSIFADMGFYPLHKERCIFIRKDGSSYSFIVVYVDDLLIIAKDISTIAMIKSQLTKPRKFDDQTEERCLQVRDLGQVRRFLGVNLERSEDLSYFTMSQEDYINELSEKFDLNQAKTIFKLPPLDTIDLTPTSDEEIDPSLPVRSIVGGLLYIANMTRPDISSAVSFLSRHLNKPTIRVLKYAKIVLNYLRSTKDRKMHLGDLDGTSLTAFADASFAPLGDRKSQTGGIIKLSGSPVSWFSKKQDTVAKSTTEAEYIALSTVADEVIWLQELMKELGVPATYPTTILEDNQPTIAVCKNQKSSKVAKHIDTRYHSLDDNILKGRIDVTYVQTDLQLADALTKVRSTVQDVSFLLGTSPDQTVQKQGVC